ncbi:MAG: hypothetical protein HZA51_10425 [Planctomycetes bacterium]|nr:hypothetical protein [Planctomycetota bacterium]
MTHLLAESITPSPQQWAVLALLGFVGLAIVVARWRSRPLDGSPTQYRREIDSANRETGQIRDDMERLLLELETLSTRLNTQLDQKHAQLQESIRDADQRIFALRALVQAARSGEPTVMSPPPLSREESRKARIYELSEKGMTTLEIARQMEQPVGEVELILNLRRAEAARPL